MSCSRVRGFKIPKHGISLLRLKSSQLSPRAPYRRSKRATTTAANTIRIFDRAAGHWACVRFLTDPVYQGPSVSKRRISKALIPQITLCHFCGHRTIQAKARQEPASFVTLYTLGVSTRELWVRSGLRSHPTCLWHDCPTAAKIINCLPKSPMCLLAACSLAQRLRRHNVPHLLWHLALCIIILSCSAGCFVMKL